MPRLPILSIIDKKTSTIGIFRGLNRTEQIQDNEFRDMQNMTSSLYPVASPRPQRGNTIAELENPNGLYWKNGLAYVDGTKFYYKGEEIGEVSDSPKTLVGMGAYIVIMPDKKIFNTSQGGELEDIEETWTQTASATIAPTYDGSVYTKISCTGIGKAFLEGDAVTISGCTISDFNKTTAIESRGDDYIVIVGQIESQTTQASGLKVTRTMPDMDFMCEQDNRLWGCSSKNHEIYACKLGDPKNWNYFQSTAADSYAATVGSDGDFTGCISHMGYVLFFKEECIIKVYGNKPSNIQLNTYAFRGVAKGCEKSLCIVNETLYYASRDAIMSYDGAMPESVSTALGTLQVADASAEQYQSKYYISMQDRSGKWILYAYDTQYQMWHKEDMTQFRYAEYGEGDLYYIGADNILRKIYGGNEEGKVPWYAESGDQIEGDVNKKKISRIQIMAEIDVGTTFEVYVQYDGYGEWERVYTETAMRKHSVQVSVKPRRCDFFRYKIKGKGPFRLYAVAKQVQHGSGR